MDWPWFTTRLDRTGSARFLLRELDRVTDGIPAADLDYYRENRLLDADTLAILSRFAEGAPSRGAKRLGVSDDLVIGWGEAERLTEGLRLRRYDPVPSDGLAELLSDLGMIRKEAQSAFLPLTSVAVPKAAGSVLLGAMNPELRGEVLDRVTSALKVLESGPGPYGDGTRMRVGRLLAAARDLLAATPRKEWGVVVIAR